MLHQASANASNTSVAGLGFGLGPGPGQGLGAASGQELGQWPGSSQRLGLPLSALGSSQGSAVGLAEAPGQGLGHNTAPGQGLGPGKTGPGSKPGSAPRQGPEGRDGPKQGKDVLVRRALNSRDPLEAVPPPTHRYVGYVRVSITIKTPLIHHIIHPTRASTTRL